MKDQRPGASRVARVRWLSGAAWLMLGVTAAHAQNLAAVPAIPVVKAPPSDGLGADGYYLESDLLIRDDKTHTLTARGDVEARYEGRTLRAQEVVYDTESGVVTAKGKVQLINADGTAQFADEMTLDKDLKAGFALGFSARMDKNVKIAAASVIRRNENVQELNRAIYTPCDVCAEKPTPTWSVAADQVVEDKKRQLVYYRNAVIRLWGAPLIYLPIFWHPDPEAQRSSGFLAPKLRQSTRRGMSYQQPYLYVISPSQDVVISPQINSSVNPFLNVNWRKRFYSGYAEARLGYTYEQNIDNHGERFGQATSRSYILAKGLFDINANWKWGFSAERASDKLLFDNYNVNDVYQSRGLFTSEDRRLNSQIYATRQDKQTYFSISAISVQGLRVSGTDSVTGLASFENSDTFPLIGPLVEGRWQPETPILGGRLRVQGTGVVLTRSESPYASGTNGVDSQRGSVNADWRSNITLKSGVRVSPFVQARGDAYRITQIPGTDSTQTYSRALGVTGVDLSYPLMKPLKNGSIVLEPLAQIAVGSDSRSVPVVVGTSGTTTYLYNEDSTSFEFDETNLFRANKSPGFDLYEGGQRLNVGGRATVTYDDGRGASVLVGRSFRSETDLLLPSRSGLQNKSSDWIVAGTITPIRGVTAFARTRYAPDQADNKFRRIEAGLDGYGDRGFASMRYVKDQQDAGGTPLETFEMRGQLNLTKRWGITAYGQNDLEAGVWRRRDLGIVYTDDCIRIDVVYQNEDKYSQVVTGGLKLKSDESVTFRLSFATLGDTGYND